MQHPSIIVGTSGFSYPQWRPGFYSTAGKQLEQYAAQMQSVEINNTFYRLPTPQVLSGWHQRTPDGFVFAVKAWRGITHDGRLRDIGALAKFLELMPHLGRKCGPILFQLPASLPFDELVFRDFLAALPPDYQYAFELRHPSWDDERAHALLLDHGAALVHTHLKGWSPRAYTAPFAYLRLHGTKAAYRGSYVDAFLRQLCYKLDGHALTHAYVYFNNTIDGTTAIDNAIRLQHFARERLKEDA